MARPHQYPSNGGPTWIARQGVKQDRAIHAVPVQFRDPFSAQLGRIRRRQFPIELRADLAGGCVVESSHGPQFCHEDVRQKVNVCVEEQLLAEGCIYHGVTTDSRAKALPNRG